MYSEVNFLHLEGRKGSCEDWVLENLHNAVSGSIGVANELVISHHAFLLEALLLLSSQPIHKFLVLLLVFEGIEHISLLTEETVDDWCFFLSAAALTIHEVELSD